MANQGSSRVPSPGGKPGTCAPRVTEKLVDTFLGFLLGSLRSYLKMKISFGHLHRVARRRRELIAKEGK